MASPRLPLNDGASIPAIGLGTFQGSYDYMTTHTDALAATASALDAGYRHFNTSAIYDTEAAIGEVINDKVKLGVIQREEVFICTKLWCTDHRQDRVVPSLRRSLSKLGLSYVDLYVVHWPMAMPPSEKLYPKNAEGHIMFEDDVTSLHDTWKGMEECKELGLAKSIGVSNYNTHQLQRVLDSCTIKPAVNEVECHVHSAQTEMADFCAAHDIRVVCYSPLGKPARPWKKEGEPSVFDDQTLADIAQHHNKTVAQISLRWLYQRGLVAVPKSSNPERQQQNINIFDFELTKEEMATIQTCDKGFRKLAVEKVVGESLAWSKEWPF